MLPFSAAVASAAGFLLHSAGAVVGTLTCNVRVLVVHVHLDGVGHKHEHLLALVQQNHEPQVADALQQAAYRDIGRLLLLSKWKLFDAC
jgi:hypothetical protein